MRSNLTQYLIGIFTLTLLSCSHKEVYYEFVNISQNQWSKNSEFCFNLDSVPLIPPNIYNIDVEITHNLDYVYKMLWLYLDQTFQDSTVVRDTLACHFTNENGKWKGSGNGPTRQVSILYKTHLNKDSVMPIKICIHHAMQDLRLTGIEKIGLKIH